MEDTYKIVRKYRDSNHPDNNKVIKEGLTLEEAQEHCNDPSTHEPGVWFDCYYEENMREVLARRDRLRNVVKVSDICHLMSLQRGLHL